ncbi:sensor histidine kinase [Haloparvum sedimenti]|uniref:sensor histidine kinase n=1 Tax=Haloparvum sedimenti TaxID=1678448 RepID=UPI00071E6BB2|nr:histidine kinase N-terminal 7TM domain-containing protein [Haloparvum sedimenti]
MFPIAPLRAVVTVAVIVGVAAAIVAWRERPEPGATPLAVLLAGQAWWAVFLVFELQAETLAAKAFWYDVQWVGVVAIPVAWLVFALEYTGRDRLVTRKTVAALCVVPAVTVLLAASGDPYGLLLRDRWIESTAFGDFVGAAPGVWYYVTAGYTYLLGLFGTIPLLQLVRDEARAFKAQSAALIVGTLAPWTTNALHLVGVVPDALAGFDPTPLSFAVTGVAYLGALTRFRLLRTSPSAMPRARRYVFDQVHEAAVVIDNHGYVVDYNRDAEAALGLDPDDALGRPAAAVVPAYDRLPETDGDTERLTIEGTDGWRPYDVTVTPLSDSRSRQVGRVVTYHDVGAYLRQQQRLDVLDRVLRHNIRTETNLIHGYASVVGEDPEHAESAAVIQESASRILQLSERTRSIASMFSEEADPLDPTPTGPLLANATERLRDRYPDATIEVGPVPESTYVAASLDVVVEQLLTNAISHNDEPNPTAWVTTAVVDDWVHVAVADDGPGIDAEEWAVIDRGRESPLEHGSGLGLWLVKWGTDLAGGRMEMADRPGGDGAVVTVEVPMLPPPADEEESETGEDDRAGGDDESPESARPDRSDD